MTTSLKAKLLPQLLGASLLLFFAVAAAYGDGNPEYVDGQVIVQCVNPLDLAAIAAQYTFDPAPISQVGDPSIYLLHILRTHTPPQVVSACICDTRILYR